MDSDVVSTWYRLNAAIKTMNATTINLPEEGGEDMMDSTEQEWRGVLSALRALRESDLEHRQNRLQFQNAIAHLEQAIEREFGTTDQPESTPETHVLEEGWATTWPPELDIDEENIDE